MKSLCAMRIARITCAAFVAVALTLAISATVLAQKSPAKPAPGSAPTLGPQPTAAELERMERDRHFQDLGLIEKVVENNKPKSKTERDREAALSQATEDFQRLLEINQQPFAPAVGALDYKQVFETTSEIEKRATRLKSNLVLPVIVPDKKKKPAGDVDDNNLMASASKLKQLLTNFLTNPVFYGNGSIDAKLQLQAARDLDGIIELSGKISKRVEKQKTAAKSD